MDETPDQEASAKLAQYLAIAVQVAEALVRARQQRTNMRAHAMRAVPRASRRAPQNDPPVGQADRASAGRSTGATAADAVDNWIADIDPEAFRRVTRLRAEGADRLDAMRTVLVELTADLRPGALAAASDAQAHADTAAYRARTNERTPDDPGTPFIDEHAEGVVAAMPRRDDQVAWQYDADGLRATDLVLVRRNPASGQPHTADVAGLAFRSPYTRVTPALPAPPHLPALPPGAVRAASRPIAR